LPTRCGWFLGGNTFQGQLEKGAIPLPICSFGLRARSCASENANLFDRLLHSVTDERIAPVNESVGALLAAEEPALLALFGMLPDKT
jgi:hypothetical protein